MECLLTDGVNGLWISRLLRRADQVALIASRVMGLAVGSISLLVAVFALARCASPALANWSEGKEMIFGLTLVGTLGASFLIAVQMVKRPGLDSIPLR